jgi:uncharacterized repeat protein (TIGR01451 family)
MFMALVPPALISAQEATPIHNRAVLSHPSMSESVIAENIIYRALQQTNQLRLTKEVSHTVATIGDTITYTINFQNNSHQTVWNAQFVDALPNGVNYISGSARINETTPVDESSQDKVEFALGNINPGGIAHITFQALIQGPSSEREITNTAEINGAFGSVLSNRITTSVRFAQPSITKEGTNGNPITYQLTVQNTSNEINLRNAVVTDTLSNDLSFLNASPTPNRSGQVLTWNVPTLQPGESFTIQIEATANAGAAGDILNRAWVESPGFGNTPSFSSETWD